MALQSKAMLNNRPIDDQAACIFDMADMLHLHWLGMVHASCRAEKLTADNELCLERALQSC